MDRNYAGKLLLFTLLILALIAGVFLWLLPDFMQPRYFVMTGIFFLLTGGAHLYIFRSLKGRPQEFNNRFMITTLVKLLVVLGVMVAALLINRAGVVPFVLVTFLLYILFTAFELRELTSLVKKN